MEISATLLWIVAGLVMAGAEMMVGTLYLLLVGTAAIVAGLASWIGLSLAWQCTVFAVVAVAGSLAVHRLRISRNESAERLQNMDEGQPVTVDAWNADGTALVRYRGAGWRATASPGTSLEPGRFVIDRVDGSRLVLRKE